ncbi:hypothetical protein ACFPRL_13530 [Pseudoclavibacter helvolus]
MKPSQRIRRTSSLCSDGRQSSVSRALSVSVSVAGLGCSSRR